MFFIHSATFKLALFSFFLSFFFTDGVVRPMIFIFTIIISALCKIKLLVHFFFSKTLSPRIFTFFFKKRKMFVLEHWWILSLCLPVFLKQGEKYYFDCHYGFVFLLKLMNKYDIKYFYYSFLCREYFKCRATRMNREMLFILICLFKRKSLNNLTVDLNLHL